MQRKKILKRVLLAIVGLVAAALVTFVVAFLVLENRTFDAPFPELRASQDPAVIARGKYLVRGPAHCVDCHGTKDRAPNADGDVPLAGGFTWHLPVGTIRAPNLTSDVATGLGAWRDEEIARALRHGVGRDGRALVPFMSFANMSDADLTAIISYLRTLPAVEHRVRVRELNLLGRVLKAFMLKPRGPSGPVAASVTPAPTAEYGRYLVHAVANCVTCHTKSDMRTGKPTAPLLSGGLEIESHDIPGRKFVTPNLTPDPKTGWISSWAEELFVRRFRAGVGLEGSPMPWASYGRMTDDDLRAIYRYLRTVPPVENATGPSLRTPVSARPGDAARAAAARHSRAISG